MELRYNEVERARNIHERYVQCLPTVKAWVRFAKFEMKNGQIGPARQCYERAVGELGEDGQNVSHSLESHATQGLAASPACHEYAILAMLLQTVVPFLLHVTHDSYLAPSA